MTVQTESEKSGSNLYSVCIERNYIKILLLSGGSGRRLWPLSNDNCSKQYIKIMNKSGDESGNKCSMLQRVFDQLSKKGLGDEAVIIASEAQTEIIQSQLGKDTKIATEPERRDPYKRRG